jgi:hypothetical protein
MRIRPSLSSAYCGEKDGRSPSVHIAQISGDFKYRFEENTWRTSDTALVDHGKDMAARGVGGRGG